MSCRIVFLPNQVEILVPYGTLLSDAAKSAGVFIDSPCGGNGTCGKCKALLTEDGRTQNVLSCQKRVVRDCSVSIDRNDLHTMSEGTERDVSFSPYLNRVHVKDACFAAFDLGTTSIVCHLTDASTGEQLISLGIQNPQSAYGADVISRANHVLTSGEPDALRISAIAALNDLLLRATHAVNRTPEQVVLVSIVGNTVMHHILLGLPLEQLVRAPYTPSIYGRQLFPVRELGLTVHQGAMLLIQPVVGGFVGADTVACMSATAFDQIKTPTLMLDIGTNGELVCTDGVRRVCCSTAAGPAFEGATLACGMRAEPGAVDHAWLENGKLAFSTIGNAPARGICGSGLIDLISALLTLCVIDETGRLQTLPAFADRIMTTEAGLLAFLVSEGETKVFLSQKDIRELQLGKAAIRAGISVLLSKLNLTEDAIERVLLAGAFGSHLSPDSLCDIGLLPEVFRGKVESIGNAAGEGAKLYVKNYALFEASERLARDTDYIELTLAPEFSNHYIESMSFPADEA